MDMPTIDAAFGITIAIGLILGFSLAFVLFREKKVESLGFAPNDLAEWMIPERWGDVFAIVAEYSRGKGDQLHIVPTVSIVGNHMHVALWGHVSVLRCREASMSNPSLAGSVL